MNFRYDIGFLGGGQLARMSAQAAQRMGLTVVALDPDPNCCFTGVGPTFVGALDDVDRLKELCDSARYVTLENEFVPAETLAEAMRGTDSARLTPGIETLATIQDKLLQRQALARAGVPSPHAVAISGDGNAAIAEIGFPMMLKARKGGYDGKGAAAAHNRDDFLALKPRWERGDWLAERFVPFRQELAVMVYVCPSGIGAFPTMVTVQEDHVCDLVFPARVDATSIAVSAVEAVGGNGLFGVELFELENGELMVNEIAPRPHNSGHYTLDWGGVSQFEQHVRLTCGMQPALPSGQAVCMANLLGQGDSDDFRRATTAVFETCPDAHVHWYGKASSRKGRKMGHLNAIGEDAVATAIRARTIFYDNV